MTTINRPSYALDKSTQSLKILRWVVVGVYAFKVATSGLTALGVHLPYAPEISQSDAQRTFYLLAVCFLLALLWPSAITWATTAAIGLQSVVSFALAPAWNPYGFQWIVGSVIVVIASVPLLVHALSTTRKTRKVQA